MLYLKIVTDMMPKRFGGYTLGPIILIRPAYIFDKGLLEHEKVHVRQFWRSFGVFGILYSCSKKYRFRYEVEAYKEQLKYSPQDLMKFCVFLSTNYDLDISVNDALAALRSDK